MKELSIEEKANAYDNVRNKIAARFGSNVAQEIFSEYEESEDEKIRKWLINEIKIKHHNLDEDNVDFVDKAIAWLERQGGQDNVEDVDILHRFSFYSYKDEPNVLYLSGLYVNEEYRNKGIGTKILEVADEVAKSLNCHAIRLKTKKDSNAEKLYRTHGYNSLITEERDGIWFEKQGEKTKPIEGFDTEFEIQISHLIASAIDREHEYNEGYVKWTANALLEYAKRELEKQGERKSTDNLTQQEAMDIAVAKRFEQGGQKPVDKVEPKFNIGDWIVSDLDDVNEDFRLCKIIGIEDGCYTIQSANGCKGYNFFEIWESDYHLWSIEDAKDGDILVSQHNKPFIYNGNYNEYKVGAYCGIDTVEEFFIDARAEKCWTNNESINPATKEQRDMLFQKMHDAGYTFDFESKELKKIEPLTDFEKAFQGMCCEKNKQFVKECCKTLIELARKQLQSERNELELDETSYKVGVSRVLENPESYGLTKNYLKPSSSDIEALEDIMNGNSNPTSYLVLQSIIEQLKTLK